MKKLKHILLPLILVSSLWLAIQKPFGLFQPKQDFKKISVNQQINVADVKSTNTYQLKNGETALDLLKRTAEIKTDGNGVNAFVTTINKMTADPAKKEYWAFYINGKMADVGAGSYKLKSGDKIEWRIENY